MNLKDVRVAIFLFVRYIRGSNKWTTSLILFVMLLTFLNLIVIGGLLEGIIVGSLNGTRDKALGDIFITAKEGKPFIDRTQRLIANLENDSRVKAFSPRYAGGVSVIEKSEYYNVTDSTNKQKVLQTTVLGVDPDAESQTTHLEESIIEGQYFLDNDREGVLIGRALLERYSPFGENVLGDVYAGDSIYIDFSDNDQYKRYIVRGIFRTKAGELDLSIIMNNDEVRLLQANPANDSNFIAVRLHNTTDAIAVQQRLINLGYDKYAKIETIEEAVGPFLDDIRITFKTLGAVVGGIGLIVASITIFIIIFVTATSRQRFIGILKGIGVAPNAIRLSYVFYACFFSVIGTILGLLLLFFVLIPYFQANPIDFPFSDGILYVTSGILVFRITLILIATLIAGFIPAYYIVRKPAIQSIMNR